MTATTPTPPVTRIRPDRSRRRNRLLLAGLLPSLVALLVAGSLLLTLHRNDTGLVAYGGGEFDQARTSFAANRWFGQVEPWVAPFNEGDAHFFLGEYESAVQDFQSALLVVPLEYECRVRLNIALARERIGDAAPDPASARAERAWRDARDALAAGDCTTTTDLVEDPEEVADAERIDSAELDPDNPADPDDPDDLGDLDSVDLDGTDPGGFDAETDRAAARDRRSGWLGLLDDLVDPLGGNAAEETLVDRAVETDERLAEKLEAALERRDRQDTGRLTAKERRELEQLAKANQRAQETEAKDPPRSDAEDYDDRPDYRW